MPELPELEVARERIAELARGPVVAAELKHFFTVRSFDPPFASLAGQRLIGTARQGKRLVLSFDRVHVVIHLMLMGRLHWRRRAERRASLWRLDFESGSLQMTEASSKKTASVHLLESLPPADEFEPLSDAFTVAALASRLRAGSRRLKSALTDGSIAAGVGNAYSDEILFEARLSPLALTDRLSDGEVSRLHASVPRVLREWTVRVRASCKFLPDDQRVWRSKMKVHGRFKKPCPVCGARIERISYAERDTHYCPSCQTGGKLLADRRYSRFVK